MSMKTPVDLSPVIEQQSPISPEDVLAKRMQHLKAVGQDPNATEEDLLKAVQSNIDQKHNFYKN